MVIGLMKDELKGQILDKFIGLRSKLYAIKIYNKDENLADKNIPSTSTAKGVVKS